MDVDDIMSIDGIGKKTAEIIIKQLKKLIKEGT
jgi:Holliday junction resolvasome RuvABC DNA-binding subunit